MRRASQASQQLTAESYRRSPQEQDLIDKERSRTLEIQNQPRTLDAQEWMRSKGVLGRSGTPEWREGRTALLEEYRDKLPPNRDWAHAIIEGWKDGTYTSKYGYDQAVAALRIPVEAA